MCDIKSTWNNLNKILKNKNVDNNVAVTATYIIASEFNNYFTTIANKLISQIPNHELHFLVFN